MKSIGIVGGGVGGLALAGLLARRGHAVSVYEAGELGGKAGRLLLGGVWVSTGPSLFTFPGVWRRVLARLGERDPLRWQALPGLGDHLVLGQRVPLPVPPDHPLHPHWARYEREVAPLAPHLETLLVTPPHLLEPSFLGASAQLGRVLGGHLSAQGWLRARRFPPALHHALAAHALNAGVGPRAGSSLYALLPALVARDVWRPQHGLSALVDALADFAAARGVALHPRTPVLRLFPERGEVQLEGRVARHDLLVSALDPTRLAPLLGRRARGGRLSVSGVALYARGERLPLPPTTVVPPSDYHVFEAALAARAFPPDTLALVHHDAQQGLLSVLLSAPPSGQSLTPDHPWVAGQLWRLERLLGVPMREVLQGAASLSPREFARWGATGGAIYGRALPAWRSGPFHPEPYRLCARLWQVGGGVHPGGGLPAVLGGALIVDELMSGGK